MASEVVSQTESPGACKNESEPVAGGKDLTGTVAKHYNELRESGLDQRTQSRIFYLRNFNNWIKSMAIGDMLGRLRQEGGPDDKLTVLDLCSGKGGDLLKWKKGRIDKLVCADIAATSVEQCENRYKEMQERAHKERHASKLFSAEFIAADCTKQRLKDLYKDRNMQFDLVSCQFSFHYSFESEQQAEMMLRNACESLRPGGYFLGTTPNAFELVKRLRASDSMSFGNDVYQVSFQTDDKENLPLFGTKYDFHLEGVVDCPEFLVYFPLLEKLAEKYSMRLVHRTPFAEFFSQQLKIGDGRGLIGRMQGLEPYPAEEGVELMGKHPDDYSSTQRTYEDAQKKAQTEDSQSDGHRDRWQDRRHDSRGNKPTKVGTLSQAEWEAAAIYVVFAFQKVPELSLNKKQHLQLIVETESPKRALTEEDSDAPEEKIPRT